MEITITKRKNRNTLLCKRDNGSITRQDLGPDFPYHDIAHYIVEKKFKLEHGFFGKIKSGMSIAELSDKEIIKKLGIETWLSEVMSRNLQCLGSGAAKAEQYIELVNWEMKNIGKTEIPIMSLDDIKNMKSDFDELCKKWDQMPENGELSLKFD